MHFLHTLQSRPVPVDRTFTLLIKLGGFLQENLIGFKWIVCRQNHYSRWRGYLVNGWSMLNSNWIVNAHIWSSISTMSMLFCRSFVLCEHLRCFQCYTRVEYSSFDNVLCVHMCDSQVSTCLRILCLTSVSFQHLTNASPVKLLTTKLYI